MLLKIAKTLPGPIRRKLLALGLLRVVGDIRAVRQLQRLRRGEGKAGGAPVAVRVHALGGALVYLRPGSSDADVLIETFLGRYHLPPAGFDPAAIKTIVDLGANIGLTAADLAFRYPGACVYALEMVPENAALARLNVSAWSSRCQVVEGAAWSTEGEVAYDVDRGGEWSASISPSGTKHAVAVTLGSLVEKAGSVDYMKMDVEGSERRLLSANTEWARSVRCLRVEVHPPYETSECVADLSGLGFDCRVDRRIPSHVQAVRRVDIQGELKL